jgi:hypothetical protein
MVMITFNRGGNLEELEVILSYLSYDLDGPPPTMELRDVIDYCSSRVGYLSNGCGANEHHILWKTTDINTRVESLADYLVSLKLDILNRGNKPTFVISNRKDVIDLTLRTNHMARD